MAGHRGGGNQDGCAVLERPLRTVVPEFVAPEGPGGPLMRYREYPCQVTGPRVDSEIVKEGDEALHDIVIGGAGTRARSSASGAWIERGPTETALMLPARPDGRHAAVMARPLRFIGHRLL